MQTKNENSTKLLKRLKSIALEERMKEIVPGGVNSPVRSCSSVLPNPLMVNKGLGALIFDVDGNAYIDFCNSWGALIHGHAHPDIVHAIQDQAALGTSFGISTPLEEEVARKVVSMLPSIEKVRFVSSGTEATMTAARLARGYTKRPLIVKFTGNYHGHADFFLVNAGSGAMKIDSGSSSAGIPSEIVKHTVSLPYNDIETVRAFLNDPTHSEEIAGVIVEPVAGNIGLVPASKKFLEMLREECSKIGAVLIFDEVISGFRASSGGAQKLLGITPDLTCLGKIVGGGLPAAAFGGKAEIMSSLAPQGNVFQAGTLSGNPLAMAAASVALGLLETENFYEDLERKTKIITEPVKACIKERRLPICVNQVGSMFSIFFGKKEVKTFDDAKACDEELFGQFFRHLFSKGIYLSPSFMETHFISTAHDDRHLEATRDAILEFIQTEM
jgi:glutamate-1-semialdehyde 2,1-aminomutase